MSLTLLPAFTAQAATIQESEPNNPFAEATFLAFGDTVTGNITETDHLDYYRVELDSPGMPALTTYMQWHSIIFMILMGMNYGMIATNETKRWVIGGTPYELFLEAGIYYGKVNGKRYNCSNQSTGRYELSIDFEPAGATNQEPDNSFVTATSCETAL